MSDARSAPRINVAWRGAMQVSPGKIIAIKVVNFSANGVQFLCPHLVPERGNFQMMIEIPDRRDASRRTQVVCKGSVLYCILSGNEYRVGMKIVDIPPQHNDLVNSWANSNGK
mgnify:FL=1